LPANDKTKIDAIKAMMDSTIVSAMISAFSGLLGAALGVRWTIKATKEQAEVTRLSNAQYLTIHVALALERFAESCYGISFDIGEEDGRPAGTDGQCQATRFVVEFEPLELGVDWKSLPGQLMYDVLTFPQRWRGVVAPLDDWHAYYDPPDHSEYFADRQRLFTKVGIEAIELAQRLHGETGLRTGPSGPTSLAALLRSRKEELDVEEEKWKAQRESTKPNDYNLNSKSEV